ncbi:MAG: hypothetical protein M1536_03340 [Firmicutes bacterium]|nr:hypothetical protein [Bacillota bacterium]
MNQDIIGIRKTKKIVVGELALHNKSKASFATTSSTVLADLGLRKMEVQYGQA